LFQAQALQPLSQLWKIHLSLISSKIAQDMARESLRQQRQDTAYSVRDLYYQIAQTQAQIERGEANEKYLAELEVETDRNLAQQTALKGDSLSVKAQLSQQRYQLLNLRDTIDARLSRYGPRVASNDEGDARPDEVRSRQY